MLEPYEMTSVLITGQTQLQERIITELHKLKILHIVEHQETELADIGNPLEIASRLSEAIVKIRALITALDIKKKDWTKLESKRGLLEINQTTQKISEELSKNLEQLKIIEGELSKDNALKPELKILKNIDVPLEAFAPYKSLTYFRGHLKQKKLAVLKENLSKITNKFMLLDDTNKKNSFIVLFIDAENKEDASKILQKINFSPVNFTSIDDFKGNAAINLENIDKKNMKLQHQEATIKREIQKLRREYEGFLFTAEEFLTLELEKAEAPLKFAVTKNAFLIKGWVPSRQLNSTIEKLNKAGKNKVFIHSEPAKTTDNVPIKLKNKKYVQPFEFFINLYTLPNYKELDPTFFIFLTFPLLFGFMLGDFGYGLVTLILFMLLKKVLPKVKGFFNILIFASIASIIFGLLFGEFFGYEEIGNIHFPHILSRSTQINELLYLALAVGIMHINLGLILGFINERKSHGFMKALCAKGGWVVLQIGAALLALSYLKIIVLPLYVGIVFFLLSLFMLFKGEGVRALIELPSIFSNILSYARLMAIGLSSVKLAEVINEMAAEMFHGGGFLILAGVITLIIGHMINILLGSFGAFLHSLRLHYVEFFTKFFGGGAKKYIPFGAKKVS